MINTIRTHTEYHALAKENIELKKTKSTLLQEIERKNKQIEELRENIPLKHWTLAI
jgi:predicted  nucleic acid-binding Zn-ribbon protein